MRTFASMLILFLAAVVTITVMAATPVNLQTCAIPLTSGGLMGCTVTRFVPVAPDTLVRSIVKGGQGWRAFSTLTPADTVYAQDGQWHVLSTLTPALQTSTTPPPPMTTPPVVTPPADQWIALNWTCSIAHNVATCTAPLMTVSP